jgi:hypothetical protein
MKFSIMTRIAFAVVAFCCLSPDTFAQGNAMVAAATPAAPAPPSPPAGAPAATDILQIDAGNGANQAATVSYNTPVVVTITAIDSSTKKQDATFNKQVTVTTSDKTITQHTVQLTGGVGYDSLTFLTTGAIILTATGPAGDPAAQTIRVQVGATVGGCSSCFATIGAGLVVTSQNADYNDTNNILEATHFGRSTPLYMVGVAYKLPIYGPYSIFNHDACKSGEFDDSSASAPATYCFPFKAFVSFKFTPDASQTFNGFTYGVSHSLHKDLDMLFGWSYSAFNQVSPGFLSAATNVVQTQQTAGNPCYSQWVYARLAANGVNAFDGFPTQLITNTAAAGNAPICTPGAQIFNGNPLTVHYLNGFFVGVAVPISFQKFF